MVKMYCRNTVFGGARGKRSSEYDIMPFGNDIVNPRISYWMPICKDECLDGR